MASEQSATAAGGLPTSKEAEGVPSNTGAENNTSHFDDAASADDVHNEKTAAGLTKFQKVKAHFWRFKWWYLLGLAILLAILLPILFTVIIPAIVVDILKSQKIPVYGGQLQALSPTMLNMSILTQIHSPLPAKLDPMHLILYNQNTTPVTPFLELLFPETKIKGYTNITVQEQTVPVLNQTELTAWFNEFFDQPKVKLSVSAKPKVHLGSLSYTSHLAKTIEIPSLNYLNGFAVKSMDFSFKNDTKYNLKGTLNIPNSGVLTLGLGDMQFNIRAGNVNLGLINLYNLTLAPGNNSVPMEGDFYFDELVPNLTEVLDSQKTALSNGYLQLFATGNTTKVNGVHIPYLEGVLNKKRIPMTISVITLLGDVLSGVLGADQTSLLNVFGEAVGNKTMLENILDHWDTVSPQSTNTTRSSLLKRSTGGRSQSLNLLRLGLQMRKATI